jgi:starch synthase
MYSLAYGTPPLVRATGGLADTVINFAPEALAAGRANGFVCHAATPEAILGTAGWAAALWQDKAQWRQLQRNAMAGDFSWAGPARRYIDLYQRLRLGAYGQ